MGFLKDTKASAIGNEARKSFEDGAYLFTPRLNFPATMHGMSGNVSDWSHQIQAVEAEGWAMCDWSVAMDTKGRPEAYPVFRRRQ